MKSFYNDMARKYSNLNFINDSWEDILESIGSNIILLTNSEGRPATPSIKALCDMYPNLLTDMLLGDDKVIEYTFLVTDFPIISVLDGGIPIYHAPVYDKAHQMGTALNVNKFTSVISEILNNYIFETPNDISVSVLVPPNLGDPMHEFIYMHLNELAISHRLEINILQDNL